MAEDRSLRTGAAAVLLVAGLLHLTNQIVARTPLTDWGLGALLAVLGLGLLFIRFERRAPTDVQEMMPVGEGIAPPQIVPALSAPALSTVTISAAIEPATSAPLDPPSFTPAPAHVDTVEVVEPMIVHASEAPPVTDSETMRLPAADAAEPETISVPETPTWTPPPVIADRSDAPASEAPPVDLHRRESAASVPPAPQTDADAPAAPPIDTPASDAPPADQIIAEAPLAGAMAAPQTPQGDPAAVQAAVEAASDGEKSRPDDLTKIHGIGPKIAGALRDMGVDTFAKLAAADQTQLQAALEAVGAKRLGDPGLWIAQAPYAARADWEGMQQVIDAHKARGASDGE
jgi:predicted flap endonuclease-1-like 5' DNA nuclease